MLTKRTSLFSNPQIIDEIEEPMYVGCYRDARKPRAMDGVAMYTPGSMTNEVRYRPYPSCFHLFSWCEQKTTGGTFVCDVAEIDMVDVAPGRAGRCTYGLGLPAGGEVNIPRPFPAKTW